MEKAHAHAMAGGAIGVSMNLADILNARGIYHGRCEGYKSQHKDEYLQEYPRLLAMRAKVDKLLRYTPTFAVPLMGKLLRELQEFEAYMRTLTEIKWEAPAPNTVVTVGKNALLDNALAGSSYTAATYMGLIGAVSYSAIAAGDTMASHAGWTEAGTTNAPTYTAPRKTISWSAASAGAKAPSSAPVYAITGTGTAKGVFIVFGSGAVSTIDNTSGILLSAGLFTGGDQAVVNTNTVTVTYSIAL